MGDFLFPHVKKCKKCGKEIFPTPKWVYRDGNQYFCSYECFRQHEAEKPKKEIIVPKVGDTIKIISMYGIPSHERKIGKVTFIDYLGQLHGTWGKWQVIPGQDVYEIIGGEDG